MVVSAAKTPVTADELPALSARLSALGKRTELVGGHLIVMAPAGGRHGQVAWNGISVGSSLRRPASFCGAIRTRCVRRT